MNVFSLRLEESKCPRFCKVAYGLYISSKTIYVIKTDTLTEHRPQTLDGRLPKGPFQYGAQYICRIEGRLLHQYPISMQAASLCELQVMGQSFDCIQ